MQAFVLYLAKVAPQYPERKELAPIRLRRIAALKRHEADFSAKSGGTALSRPDANWHRGFFVF